MEVRYETMKGEGSSHPAACAGWQGELSPDHQLQGIPREKIRAMFMRSTALT